MITVQNSYLNEGIKRTKNGKYVDKCKRICVPYSYNLLENNCLKQK